MWDIVSQYLSSLAWYDQVSLGLLIVVLLVVIIQKQKQKIRIYEDNGTEFVEDSQQSTVPNTSHSEATVWLFIDSTAVFIFIPIIYVVWIKRMNIAQTTIGNLGISFVLSCFFYYFIIKPIILKPNT